MAKGILAGEPLLRNDLFVLAQKFEHSLDYYTNHNSPFFSDYLRAVRTLVGLGFTAALSDRHLLYLYQPHLARFLAAEERDFKLSHESKKGVARAVAEMVYTASLCFYTLKFPQYYNDFIAVLRYILTQVPGTSSEQKEVGHLLEHLTVR